MNKPKLSSLSDTTDSSEDESRSRRQDRKLPTPGSFYSPVKSSPSSPSSGRSGNRRNLKRPASRLSDDDADDIKPPSAASFPLPPKKKKSHLASGLAKESKSSSNYNDIAKRMMRNMGYQEGKGLGKHEQGRTEIIETSKQRGRRGLGRQLQGLEPGNIDWDFAHDEVVIEETINWLPDCLSEPPSLDIMRSWVREGPKKLEIGDEVEFCDAEVLDQVIRCKSVFDELEPEELRRARTRSNPYETIRGGMFLNRAAMKMANMDCVFDFMFTSPVDEQNKPMVEAGELLYFADVCAGPGGFSEYVLWRRRWEAKGFGFTLRGPNDFKLEDFFAGPCESFEPHYGVNGITGNGDVFVPENQREFRRFVMQSTEGKGVHFVMADGGFSVEGQENIQEILSKQLYLCQFLMALYILRPGGHFVCKLFDLFTPFSVGLVYLMYHCFEKVCIHKPVTSRPANSERYLVCKWRRDGIQDVCDSFYEINCRLNQTGSTQSSDDVVEVVPLHVLKDDVGFYEYIRESNNQLGERQILNLAKIRAFCRNSNLHEARQSDVRKKCLAFWKVPETVRSAPTRPDPQPRFDELIKEDSSSRSYLSFLASSLDRKRLASIRGLHDYCCLVSAVKRADTNERFFVLGLGRQNIFKWDGTSSSKWEKSDLILEVPKGTLVYGEFVNELHGEGKGQRKTRALHIIDSLVLGDEDVRKLSYVERMARTEVFVKAISKPSRPDYVPIRAKKIHRFGDIEEIFNCIGNHVLKGMGPVPRLCYSSDGSRFFVPQGIIFMKIVNDPWMIGFSNSRKTYYYYHTMLKKSAFEKPRDAIANFRSSFEKRLFWSWEDEGAEAYLNGRIDDEIDGRVDKESVLQRVAQLGIELKKN